MKTPILSRSLRGPFVLALLLWALFISCGKKKEHVDPQDEAPQEKVLPDIRTGTASFHALGGVIETFNVNFEKLGNVPIEEYGVVYAFLPATTYLELVTDGPYPVARFKAAAKQGSNTESFKIGFPAGNHALSYRAYVKLKGGDVMYAINSVNLSY